MKKEDDTLIKPANENDVCAWPKSTFDSGFRIMRMLTGKREPR